MARVYFRYSKKVLEDLAAKYGESTKKLVQTLQAREAAGEKISWPREEAPKNGTWWLDYRNAAGERTYASTKASTKGEAEKKLREKIQASEDIRSGRVLTHGKPMRVRDAAAAVLTAKKGKAAYVSDELYLRRHVLPALGSMFLAQVTAADVDTWTASMEAKGYTPGTIHQALLRLGYCYRWARKARVYLGISPIEDAAKIVIPKRTPKSFTEAQLDRFLAVAGQWTLLFQVAGILGPRKGELCGLQWQDFITEHEFPDGEVGPVFHIRRSYARPYPKGKKERIVPIPPDIAQALHAEQARAETRWVFPSVTGKMRGRGFDPSSIFKRCCVRAGIVRGWSVSCPCGHSDEIPRRKSVECPKCATLLVPKGIPPDMTFRHMRSTAATRLGDIRQAQALLGHADLKTTASHYHVQELQVIRDALGLRARGRALRAQTRDKDGTQEPRTVAARADGIENSV